MGRHRPPIRRLRAPPRRPPAAPPGWRPPRPTPRSRSASAATATSRGSPPPASRATNYGQTNAAEDMCETMAMYFMFPDRLRTSCPIRHRWPRPARSVAGATARPPPRPRPCCGAGTRRRGGPDTPGGRRRGRTRLVDLGEAARAARARPRRRQAPRGEPRADHARRVVRQPQPRRSPHGARRATSALLLPRRRAGARLRPRGRAPRPHVRPPARRARRPRRAAALALRQGGRAVRACVPRRRLHGGGRRGRRARGVRAHHARPLPRRDLVGAAGLHPRGAPARNATAST